LPILRTGCRARSVLFNEFTKSNIPKNPAAKVPWSVTHLLSREDSVAAATLRSVFAPLKGKFQGTSARDPFNAIMERVAVPEGVTFEAAAEGGISGWWARPTRVRKGTAILHVHGGWFNWGTARSFRNFVGHIALNAGANAFISDYRLAPEHPFPAAVRDLEACYRGLVEKGITRIALTGDSAGGNLALVLLSITSSQASKDGRAPVGAVAFSPVTDLALTGESYDTRAVAAGVDAKLDIWMGMPHGFFTNIGGFNAATQALNASGAFLS
jgi:monoterpene epsilon-lactone hydrolase